MNVTVAIEGGKSSGPQTLWDSPEIPLLLPFACAIIILLVWALINFTFKSKFVLTLFVMLFSWIGTIIILPLILLLLIPMFITRIGLSIYLRCRYGATVFLCHPLDSIWSFERPASSSTCTYLYVVEGIPDLSKIQKLIYERLILQNERFRRTLRNIFGFACWERLETIEINDHIKTLHAHKDGMGDWTETALFEALARLEDDSLCSVADRSPWEIIVVPNFINSNGEPGKSYYSIVFRIHHSLMDGLSMVNILHDCLSDKPFKFSMDPMDPLIGVSRADIWFARFVSLIMLPQIVYRSSSLFDKNAFHGKMLTGPKEFCWSRPMSLRALKEMKNKTSTSVVSILLSSLGGSMKKLYECKSQIIPNVIHAFTTVGIFPYPDRTPRNRFSMVVHPLALWKDCNLERLRQTHESSMKFPFSPDVLGNVYVTFVLGLLPYRVLDALIPTVHSTIGFSNIPGPAEQITVFHGDRLVDIGVWIPTKNGLGIGVAVFSYKDSVRMTINADRASLTESGDVLKLCDAFEQEVTLLGQQLCLNDPFIT